MNPFHYPLMSNNVNKEDVNALISFLQQDPIPQFTNGPKVKQFENEWGKWLGMKHNIMVGSGSMANELSLLALKYLHPDGGEILVSPLGWVSDFAAILHAGFTPVFCDINLKNLSISANDIRRKITSKTKGLLLVHVLGYNGLSDDIINICRTHNITLIEDICESPGATFKGQKVGSFGDISNCSFFYAHHLCSLAEGGMISTNDDNLFNIFRALRSHGLVRECPDQRFKDVILKQNPELNPDFIFLEASHNGRSQEVNAVVALNQLKRLDANNAIRSDNLLYFLSNLDGRKYVTDFDTNGNSNYALTLLLKTPNLEARDKIEFILKENNIEFRRGMSGGGNQIRQPYLKEKMHLNPSDFPNTEHVHHFGWYIGNYPTLEREKIDKLLSILNNINI